MTRLFCSVILLLSAVLPLWAQSAVVRVQSVECCYDNAEGEVACSVRLHVQLPQGASFVPPLPGDPAASPLFGADAAGRILSGKFRGMESCMERCRTLVYDFYARPQGGWLEFNTFIHVLFSTSEFRMNTEGFDPGYSGTLRAFNHTFFVNPLPSPGDMPGAVLFRLDYELTPLIASISFRHEDGSACNNRLIDGSYSEEVGMTSATYLLYPAKAHRPVLRLSFFHPPVPHRLPVRFRICPGLISEPPVGG